MLKFYCLLIGENYQEVKNFQSSSKRKIAMFAGGMMLPVMLWFINGFMASYVILANTLLISVITAFITAFIIFLLERLILLSNGGKIIYSFRFILGLVVAVLGSVCLDEIIFKNDIDNKMLDLKQEYIEKTVNKAIRKNTKQIENQKLLTNQKYIIWQKRLDELNAELKGLPGSSGYRGKGEVARENIKMAMTSEADYHKENNTLNKLEYQQNQYMTIIKEKAKTDFNQNALLTRIKAMFQLISEDIYMAITYSAFTIFLIMIEFIVVILKMTTQTSIDEELCKIRESMIKRKAEILSDNIEKAYNPSHSNPKVKAARSLINTHNSSLLN